MNCVVNNVFVHFFIHSLNARHPLCSSRMDTRACVRPQPRGHTHASSRSGRVIKLTPARHVCARAWERRTGGEGGRGEKSGTGALRLCCECGECSQRHQRVVTGWPGSSQSTQTSCNTTLISKHVYDINHTKRIIPDTHDERVELCEHSRSSDSINSHVNVRIRGNQRINDVLVTLKVVPGAVIQLQSHIQNRINSISSSYF